MKNTQDENEDADMSKEREAFEAWIKTFDSSPNLETCGLLYDNFNVQRAWASFQAGRASQQSAGFSAEDMASAAAQGFRDGVTSLSANAGEPTEEMIEEMPGSAWLPACYRAMLESEVRKEDEALIQQLVDALCECAEDSQDQLEWMEVVRAMPTSIEWQEDIVAKAKAAITAGRARLELSHRQ